MPKAWTRGRWHASPNSVASCTCTPPATRRALARAWLGVDDIELWEVRDSFAAITLHYIDTLGVPLTQGVATATVLERLPLVD